MTKEDTGWITQIRTKKGQEIRPTDRERKDQQGRIINKGQIEDQVDKDKEDQ